MNQLEQLKKMTTVVADTGDFTAIKDYAPEDTTTNPSLLLSAATQKENKDLLEQAVSFAQSQSKHLDGQIVEATDYFAVLIGQKLLSLIPGYNSTEVDARLSFDTDGTVEKAKRILSIYDSMNLPTERVLIKIASTWEGIQAAKALEKNGIKCNLTLLFSFAQARACADAGAFLISPFVGRILDWHKKDRGVDSISIEDDPGVASVSSIYNFYKKHDYSTIVMGASFRSSAQVVALAGCDRLTISPKLLEELKTSDNSIIQRLDYSDAVIDKPIPLTEAEFRWQLNQDAMATEKTAEGIRNFAADQEKLERLFKSLLEKT